MNVQFYQIFMAHTFHSDSIDLKEKISMFQARYVGLGVWTDFVNEMASTRCKTDL